MVVLLKHKKQVAGTHIISNVIRKFSHKEKLCSVFLLLIDKNTQIKTYCAVLFFNLADFLQKKCNGMLLLNFKKVIYQRPEL